MKFLQLSFCEFCWGGIDSVWVYKGEYEKNFENHSTFYYQRTGKYCTTEKFYGPELASCLLSELYLSIFVLVKKLLNSLLLCWVHFKSSAIHTVQLLTVAYDKLYGNNIRQPSLKISLQSVSKGKPWKTCSQLIASVVHSQVQNNYETAQGFSFTP